MSLHSEKLKPHLVVIMADQLRPDVLELGLTPNIEQLRKEGVEFSRAYCASPLCVPARGSFFSGKYPNETGCLINPWLPDEQVHGQVRGGTAHLYGLLEQEWDSWHIGKQHFFAEDTTEPSTDSMTHWTGTTKHYKQHLKEHGKRAPGGSAFKGAVPEMAYGTTTRRRLYSIPTPGCYEEGFDHYFDGYFAHQAVAALQQRDPDKPFALQAMMLAPHPPLDIPEPWFSAIRPEDVRLPDNVGVWSPNQSPLQLYNLTGALGGRYTREDWARIWPVYLGLVQLLDHCVGMIVAELKRQGMYDDTLIVFTSDHGEMLGSHCLWQKMCMYEESVKTPLVMKFPRRFQPAVHRCDELVSAIDVFPTICDYMGLSIPADVSGKSLMPLLVNGDESLQRDAIYIQFDGNGARGNFQRSVLSGPYKLIVDMFKDETFLELYDVLADPQEQSNLAFEPAHRETVCGLLERLRRHMARTGDLLTIAEPEHTYAEFIARYGPFRQ